MFSSFGGVVLIARLNTGFARTIYSFVASVRLLRSDAFFVLMVGAVGLNIGRDDK